MREGGAEGHSIHLHSERETNLTISVLSRSRVRHLGCPNRFATPQGAACPACVCAFRSSVKSEVGVTGRVRTRHISPRQSPSHSARAALLSRPSLTAFALPPPAAPFLLPVCQTSAFLPSFTERAHASVNAETKMEILECPFSDSTLHSNLPFPRPSLRPTHSSTI